MTNRRPTADRRPFRQKTHYEVFVEDDMSVRSFSLFEREMDRSVEKISSICDGKKPDGHCSPLLKTALFYALGHEIAPLGALLPWCVFQTKKFEPLWQIEADTARALLETELPFDAFPSFPKLPFPGLYCSLPQGLFQIWNEDSGMHDVEGFYLAEDQIFDEKTRKWKRAILVLGIGESREDFRHPVLGIMRDDAVIHFFLVEGKSFEHVRNVHHPGVTEVLHVVVNLLWALHTKHLDQKKERPRDLPKSTRKQKKLERKGLSARPWSVLSLRSTADRGASTRRQPTADQGERHAPKVRRKGGIVRGHWQSYWVLDSEEETVLSTKDRTKKDGSVVEGKLYCVSRWIHPHFTGERPEGVARTLVR